MIRSLLIRNSCGSNPKKDSCILIDTRSWSDGLGAVQFVQGSEDIATNKSYIENIFT